MVQEIYEAWGANTGKIELIIVESKMQHWTMLSAILFRIVRPDFCLILGTVLPPEDCGI